MRYIDLTGKVFGRWKVIAYEGKCKPGISTSGTIWKCRCSCGAEKSGVRYAALTTGASRSCGCLRREISRTRKSEGPGFKDHPQEYSMWLGMKTRCYNTNTVGYKNYGGRGIRVCEKWRHSFPNFFHDMGERPSKRHSLDRINKNLDYEPENCRWATDSEQMLNTRRTTRYDWKGVPTPLTSICRDHNVRYLNVRQRLHRGETLQQAIEWCRSRNLTFFERALSHGGGGPAARLTGATRVSRKSPVP